jgi:signal transduction histidine kinase
MNDRINILLVDDQPAKLLTYEAILSDLGENLLKANSGMEALEQLLRNDVALVIMDVSMPGMDGFETAEMIHQHPRFQNTPIMFVTGVCLSELDHLKGYQYGAVDYIPVPVIPEVLRAKVRVFADLHRKTQQLELLNARMMMLQEEERGRIARELHDSVGQLLVAMSLNNEALASESHKLSADAAKMVTDNTLLLDELNKEIRTISYLLHPPLLDESGLASALACYVEGFSKRSGIAVTLQTSPNLGRVSQEMELSMFRLVQECLTNIHRHSGSPTADIRLERNQTFIRVEVSDVGKGFPLASLEPGAAFPAHPGVGLLGMRERLRRLGGTLSISTNHPGTRVTAVIPASPADSPSPQSTTVASTL